MRDSVGLATAIATLAVSACSDAGGIAAPDQLVSQAQVMSHAGAVYTMTNDAAGNEVLIFRRAPDGTLWAAGSTGTGGMGSGGGLGNQGGVALTENGRLLVVVNAGSDNVSVLALDRSGGAVLEDVEASGGDMPISVTVHGGLVYVLNGGGAGSISGFRLSVRGELEPLAGSTRPLSGAAVGPAQVGFSPDGRWLIVTEKATNRITTYAVGSDGIAGAPIPQASHGATPFGFAFTRQGTLVVSEAFGGAPDASALSSYRVADSGELVVVSGSVATTETAACWVAISGNGRFAYTTNTGSGSVSGFAVRRASLALLDDDGVTGVTGPASGPIDAAVSQDGRFLYVLNAGAHSIAAFAIGPNGDLDPVSTADGLPGAANGLAAR